MRIIGITGGVGSGKSAVLNYIKEHYNVRIIFTDDVANEMKEPGGICYNSIVSLLGTDSLNPDGTIDKKKMAARIFADDELLKKVNDILHPAVEEYVRAQIKKERIKNEIDFLFIEAALLIEVGYRDKFLDEMWYVYAPPDIRRQRLKESRGYSDEKIDDIFEDQLTDDVFRKKCDKVIDNSGTQISAFRQADEILGGIKH